MHTLISKYMSNLLVTVIKGIFVYNPTMEMGAERANYKLHDEYRWMEMGTRRITRPDVKQL